MGAAMRKKESDPLLMKEWQDIILDLTDRTHDSRDIVKKMAKIDDKDLAGILPIHPYTAVLLPHIVFFFVFFFFFFFGAFSMIWAKKA